MIQPAKPPRIPSWWHVFLTEYMTNGQNGKQAYLVARPKVTPDTAEVNSIRVLGDARFQELLKVEQNKMSELTEFTKKEWFESFTKIARFDVSMLFEFDAQAREFRLKEDAMEICKAHGALEALEMATTTLESGQVVQRLKTKAYSKFDAVEKLGKVLGYDKTEEPKSGITKSIQVNVLNQINVIHQMTASGELTSPEGEDIEKLIEAEIE